MKVKVVHLRLHEEVPMLEKIGKNLWKEQNRSGRVIEADVMRFLIRQEYMSLPANVPA